MNRAEPKMSQWLKLILWMVFIFVVAAILFPVFAPEKPYSHPYQCLSNVKQLGTALAIYQSDFDDVLPPYYTFDGPESTGKFFDALNLYSKNEQMFKCPQDQSHLPSDQEGVGVKMSYVHCLSLKGVIPNFSDGKRLLNSEKDVVDLGVVPFLRDPIRTSVERRDDGLHSPHEDGFRVEYLDTHAKVIKHLDFNKEL